MRWQAAYVLSYFHANSYAPEFMPASALIINDVPIECLNQAAISYQIPANLIISVLKVEGGRAGLAKPNTNGTFDYGPMQINSIWLSKLKAYGYTKEQLQYDPCVNVWVGAWILSREVADSPNPWRGVANYHSHTDNKNLPYQYKVRGIYQLLSSYLSNPTDTTPAPPTAAPPAAAPTVATTEPTSTSAEPAVRSSPEWPDG